MFNYIDDYDDYMSFAIVNKKCYQNSLIDIVHKNYLKTFYDIDKLSTLMYNYKPSLANNVIEMTKIQHHKIDKELKFIKTISFPINSQHYEIKLDMDSICVMKNFRLKKQINQFTYIELVHSNITVDLIYGRISNTMCNIAGVNPTFNDGYHIIPFPSCTGKNHKLFNMSKKFSFDISDDHDYDNDLYNNELRVDLYENPQYYDTALCKNQHIIRKNVYFEFIKYIGILNNGVVRYRICNIFNYIIYTTKYANDITGIELHISDNDTLSVIKIKNYEVIDEDKPFKSIKIPMIKNGEVSEKIFNIIHFHVVELVIFTQNYDSLASIYVGKPTYT